MFTGIVQAVGRIAQRIARGGDVRLVVEAPTAFGSAGVAVGDSIAVGGVCLTVIERDASSFAADVSNETLALTTLGRARVGDAVNLELALRLADRLGGHLVSGHVDGVGAVLAIAADGRAQRYTFALPKPLARYVAVKGSICVDGTSLTVNGVGDDRFEVTLIPHTLAVTTFGARRVGDAVNLEVDLMARYAERLSAGGRE